MVWAVYLRHEGEPRWWLQSIASEELEAELAACRLETKPEDHVLTQLVERESRKQVRPVLHVKK